MLSACLAAASTTHLETAFAVWREKPANLAGYLQIQMQIQPHAKSAPVPVMCACNVQAYSKDDGYDEALTAEAATTAELERALGEHQAWGP